MIKLNINNVKQAMENKGWNQARFALEMKLKAQQLKIPTPDNGYANYVYKILEGNFIPKMDRMILMADTLGMKIKSIYVRKLVDKYKTMS